MGCGARLGLNDGCHNFGSESNQGVADLGVSGEVFLDGRGTAGVVVQGGIDVEDGCDWWDE
jgi:hypothetical protein